MEVLAPILTQYFPLMGAKDKGRELCSVSVLIRALLATRRTGDLTHVSKIISHMGLNLYLKIAYFCVIFFCEFNVLLLAGGLLASNGPLTYSFEPLVD
jgi:hypothetical protein